MRPRLFLPTALSLLTVAGAARAQCPPANRFPGERWLDESAVTSTQRAAQVAALEEYAFTLEGEIEERRGRRTDGVVIIQGGRLRYEKYARGYSADHPHLTWSVSKSVVNAVMGIALHRGLVNMDDSICRYNGVSNRDACKLTLRHLLMWGSGLEWAETYENDTPRASAVAAMLYGVGSLDMAEFTANQPFVDEPGARYQYSSGDTNLLAATLNSAMRPTQGDDYLWTELFDVIGATSSVFESDAAGTPVGSSYWYATPRDMARFGYLYLNDGCWNGVRMLPEGWVAFTMQPNPAFVQERVEWTPEDRDTAGWHWWVNVEVPGVAPVPYPDVPTDMFYASGHWGQRIYVVPSMDVVVVRTGDDRESGILDDNEFLRLALEVAR